jgi:hypothetical protein
MQVSRRSHRSGEKVARVKIFNGFLILYLWSEIWLQMLVLNNVFCRVLNTTDISASSNIVTTKHTGMEFEVLLM